MFYNSKYKGEDIEQKLDELQNVSITQDEFKYLENDIYITRVTEGIYFLLLAV